MIDEVAIYNWELSAKEIEDIYQNGVSTSSSVVSSTGKITATWGMLRK